MAFTEKVALLPTSTPTLAGWTVIVGATDTTGVAK